jgi:hypothetical protein
LLIFLYSRNQRPTFVVICWYWNYKLQSPELGNFLISITIFTSIWVTLLIPNFQSQGRVVTYMWKKLVYGKYNIHFMNIPPSSAEDNIVCSYTSTPSCIFMAQHLIKHVFIQCYLVKHRKLYLFRSNTLYMYKWHLLLTSTIIWEKVSIIPIKVIFLLYNTNKNQLDMD